MLSLATVVLSGENNIQLPPEWHLWKAKHVKKYNSFNEELQKHIMWKSNHQYIDAHNAHKEIYGFTLQMNQFGDLVFYLSLFLYSSFPFLCPFFLYSLTCSLLLSLSMCLCIHVRGQHIIWHWGNCSLSTFSGFQVVTGSL